MINCNKCNKKIKDSNDVNVLALFGIKPTTMCNSCYASRERGITRHLFYYPRKFPINSKPFILILSLVSVIWLILVIGTLLGKAEVSGSSTGVTILLFTIAIILMGWQWVLWFIAKGKVNAAKN